ncbi:MAG TPA: DUF1634 domain-containing protein [Acidobacteriaceae bacterium]|jgi:uncharacterized membrane protein
MTEPIRKHAPTAKPRREPTREEDQRLEVAIAILLRIGVVAAAVLVAIGGMLVLRHPEAPVPDYRIFHAPGESASAVSAGTSIHSISAVFRQLSSGSGASIIALGLLVLIATPIARVIFAIAGFARERDVLYTVVSLIVLAILTFSLIHGR